MDVRSGRFAPHLPDRGRSKPDILRPSRLEKNTGKSSRTAAWERRLGPGKNSKNVPGKARRLGVSWRRTVQLDSVPASTPRSSWTWGALVPTYYMVYTILPNVFSVALIVRLWWNVSWVLLQREVARAPVWPPCDRPTKQRIQDRPRLSAGASCVGCLLLIFSFSVASNHDFHPLLPLAVKISIG